VGKFGHVQGPLALAGTYKGRCTSIVKLFPERVPAAADALAVDQRLPVTRKVRRRSERALIRGAQAGSEADLEELFRRHWRRAYRVAFLIVHDHAGAEDIAQEAFVSAIRSLGRFDRRRPFGPWLARIVTNRAIDWTRSRAAQREVNHEPPELAGLADTAVLYSDEVLGALATLSPEHRAVVVMRYVLDCTPGEIAQALELPRGTVNSRLRRALDVLGERLAEVERR
jgi:RNA polymerase sigma-70 factor (ECF subfamily)